MGAEIDTTKASGKVIFGIFVSLAEFERELIRERTLAGLQSARSCGRVGGRKTKMTKAKVRLAHSAMGKKETVVSDLCKESGIARHINVLIWHLNNAIAYLNCTLCFVL